MHRRTSAIRGNCHCIPSPAKQLSGHILDCRSRTGSLLSTPARQADILGGEQRPRRAEGLNAIALMATNPWSTRPNVYVIYMLDHELQRPRRSQA